MDESLHLEHRMRKNFIQIGLTACVASIAGCGANTTSNGPVAANTGTSTGGTSITGVTSVGGAVNGQGGRPSVSTASSGGTGMGGTQTSNGATSNGATSNGATSSTLTSATTTAGGTVVSGGRTTAGGTTAAAGGATQSGGTTNAKGGSSTAGGMATGGVATATSNSTAGGTKASVGSAGSGALVGGGAGVAGAVACPKVEFGTWISKKDPLTIGKLAVADLKNHMKDDYGGAGYSLAFAWYGALRFTKLQGESTTDLVKGFDDKLAKSPPSNATGVSRDNGGPGATVDDRAFGVLPLEIYIEQGSGNSYRDLGIERAKTQWSDLNPQTGEPYNFRYWSDDMYMITGLQVQAYRATGESVYLVDHAASAMKKYIKVLQQPPGNRENQKSGLFWHTRDSHAYWCRANGWVAAGMTELLLELAPGETRDIIMAAFKDEMDALLTVQIKKGETANDADLGCWRQVLDLPSASAETSCTAMFTYALANAVKNGWLNGRPYVDAAHDGWACVANKTDKDTGKLAMVCPGTGAAPNGELPQQQAFYSALVDPNKPPTAGDLHGQAPLLWAATALLKSDCPGLR